MFSLVPFLHAEPVSEINEIRSPKEIYTLLDAQQWESGIKEAKRLLESQPTSAIAFLTLGDALAHYSN